VTPLGLAAAVGGALAVALPAALLTSARERGGASRMRLLGAVTLAGVAGSLIDSALGATWQAMSWCPACATWTERSVHRCGTPTEVRRGARWMTNDAVNALATSSAAVLAQAALSRPLRGRGSQGDRRR
jgi:uncharacterized membrane protein